MKASRCFTVTLHVTVHLITIISVYILELVFLEEIPDPPLMGVYTLHNQLKNIIC